MDRMLFVAATLLPALLVMWACILGGPFAWAALAFGTVVALGLDGLIERQEAAPGVEFPAQDALAVTLALVHVALLPLVVWAVAGDRLTLGEKAATFTAASWFFGQVSNSVAHELIHRGSRRLHRLGVAVYVTLLYGHHASAHALVHHVHVGTARDPATARRGEGFWRYAIRAWGGSFRAGLAAERARAARLGRRTPYPVYLGGAAAVTLAMALAFGLDGLAVFLALCASAQLQLLMSDYVQHYGLTRRETDGLVEPVGPRHSWNAPHRFSAAMMLNAPRHSDHHAHPGRGYADLRLDDGMPMLPASLPVMACLATLPPLWRRVMDPRAAAWR